VPDRAFPSVFVSHGPPTLILGDNPATAFLRGLGDRLGRPKAVLCVSAHWETPSPSISTATAPETIHDFHGFPDALYALDYPAPGAPDLAARVAEVLADAGLPCTSEARGFDHGVWTPMMLMYPDADVPVASLSIQHHLGPAAHIDLGRALAPLRGEGVLILGSGGSVHNLRHFVAGDSALPEWAERFDAWLTDVVTTGDGEALAGYRDRTPDGALAHPRDEHLLPLMVAMGAGGEGARGEVLFRGFISGAIGMGAYAFA
jgi:4,5-DOPA dioxygenase extradiol